MTQFLQSEKSRSVHVLLQLLRVQERLTFQLTTPHQPRDLPFMYKTIPFILFTQLPQKRGVEKTYSTENKRPN
jgi:hypothetical protein